MAYPRISRSDLDFLKDLTVNNNREWFATNKDRYTEAKTHWKAFSEALMEAMQAHDHITDYKVWRIYRDVRFSKDKTPYNTHYSVGLTRAKPQLRGGYYLRIKPGESIIAGGFWGPNKDDLKRIRQEIAADATPLRSALADPTLTTTFGSLQGDQLKTAPRGYDKAHPDVDLLRYKQFLHTAPLSQKQVLSKDLIPLIVDHFLALRPFFDVMTDILTTDENGVPLY